jgi:hypothetical protein
MATAVIFLFGGCGGNGGEELIVFVSESGSASNSGLSASEPKSTISDGIAAAQSNGYDQVRAAAGTYTISESIYLAPGISVLGGYNGDFSSRDMQSNTTTIRSDNVIIMIRAEDEGIDNSVILEGFTIENKTSLTGSPLGVYINNGASPTIKNNTIAISNDLSGTESYVYGILIANTAVTSVKISGNTISVSQSDAGGTIDSARAIYVDTAEGSNVTIEKNVITSVTNQRADGIRCASPYGTLTIANNIVSVNSSGGSTYPIVIDNGTATTRIINNTIITNAVTGIYEKADSGGTTLIINNIIASVGSVSDGIRKVGTGHITATYNLIFNCTNGATGVTLDATNDFNASDIFTTVFSSSYDSDLTDGDDSDYRLNDPGSAYAVDKGTNVSDSTYGAVIDDIDGNSRPVGGAYDRGAYEKQ